MIFPDRGSGDRGHHLGDILGREVLGDWRYFANHIGYSVSSC